MDEDELVLVAAGLMHDVGKVVQRSGRPSRHQNLSEKFVADFLSSVVDVSNVRDLVLRHHEGVSYGPLGFLVRADHVSAMERDVELEEDNMASYKSLYRLLQSPLTNKFYYGLNPLDLSPDLKALKPVVEKTCSENDYENLLKKLEGELGRLKQLYSGSGNGLAYIVTLAEVLRKYLFFCPSAPSIEREPTNSLYEHSRMVAALSICLKRSDGKGFTIVYGDVGGIQRFVYGQRVYKGALKSLRGRSLYITILSDAIAKHLLLTLDLPHVNLVYSSGGNFMLVCELLNEERKRMLVEEVNRFLLNRHKGLLRLSLGFADVRLGDDDRSRISNDIAEAQRDARRGKEQVFYDLLKYDYGLFFEPKIAPSGSVCESCGLEIDGGERVQGGEGLVGEELPVLCSSCSGLIKLAKEVASARYLVEVWMDEGCVLSSRFGDVLNFTVDGLRVAYMFVEKPREIERLRGVNGVKLIWVKRLNDTDFLGDAEGFVEWVGRDRLAFGFSIFTTHTPLDENGDIMSFDDLVSRSEGQRMVGFLKLDLDRVGELVARHSGRLSNLATVSQLLSLIMEGCVNVVAKPFRYVYLIYSGGDDLLAVGPWNEVVDFACKLSGELEGLIGGGLSFTAALYVDEPKAPVKVVMDSLSDVLRRAKKDRDRIAIGVDSLGWSNFRRAVEFAEKWAADIEAKRVSRSLVFDVAYLFKEYDENKYWTSVRHRLKYVLARSFERVGDGGVPGEIDRLEKEYLQELSVLFPFMRVVAWLVTGLTRE